MVTSSKNTLFNFKSFIFVVFLFSAMLAALLLYDRSLPEPQKISIDSPQRLLVVATHQDDGVIMAGGLAIRNDLLQGQTKVVFITRPVTDNDRLIRYQESEDVWYMLPSKSASVEFLDVRGKELRSLEMQSLVKVKLADIISDFDPTITVFPLLEGGHPEHDIVAELGSQLSFEFPNKNILFSAGYNPLYILDSHVSKILWFFVRLMPFVPHITPNTGIDPRNQTEIELSPSELAFKKEMLLGFVSQREVISLYQFGYADLFDTSNISDYSTIELANKQFSGSALMVVFTILVFLYYSGIAIAHHFTGKIQITLAFMSVGILSVFLVFDRNLFKEDFLLLYTVFAGMFSYYLVLILRQLFCIARN
jgi:LmbE family N-acetylglucosaminyl deacetylase